MRLLRVSLLAAILDQASKYLVVKYFRFNDSVALIQNYL